MSNEKKWLEAKAILDALRKNNIIGFYAWYHALLIIRKELNMPIF